MLPDRDLVYTTSGSMLSNTVSHAILLCTIQWLCFIIQSRERGLQQIQPRIQQSVFRETSSRFP